MAEAHPFSLILDNLLLPPTFAWPVLCLRTLALLLYL